MKQNSLAKRFKYLRENDLDLSQVELAEMIGVKQATISAIETGKSKSFSLENLIKLVEVCYEHIEKHLSLNWLIMNYGPKFLITEKEAKSELAKIMEAENCYFDKDGILRKKI